QQHMSETGQENPLPFPQQSIDASVLEPNSTSNLLQLARRLHDEHVQEGIQKRDALIAEGHSTAARIVAEAEAENKAAIRTLEQEKAQIQHGIDELQNFEREYRVKLRNYIESQLQQLDVLPAEQQ